MHQKKSEVQIGKDSSGVSSDFNPNPVISSSVAINPPHKFPVFQSTANSPSSSSSPSPFSLILLPSSDHNTNTSNITTPSTNPNPNPNPSHQHQIIIDDIEFDPFALPTPKSTPHKRPLFFANDSQFIFQFLHSITSFIKPPKKLPLFIENTLLQAVLQHESRRISPSSPAPPSPPPPNSPPVNPSTLSPILLLLSLPSKPLLPPRFPFRFCILHRPLFSLNLALPRLPSIRLFLSRSFPSKLYSLTHSSRPHLPVFWPIGSRQKCDKRTSSGCWVQAYNNGDVYEGEFHKGKCSGCGVYYYYMSGRYEGDWVDGKYDGYGMETWARGSRYRGQYRQGLRHGFGVYRFYTGDVYAGEWSNGQSHGCGVHTCEDGSRYVGEFKWGVKHGLGHYHFRNGDTYSGEYFADKMHGFGVYSFANGHRYEGSWHEGRRQGLGMYTFRNGETQSGHWQNGVLDVPSSQSAMFPVSPVAVYHSKVLNAIQEARRAAEKAYDVAKVDERVNRAVAAANRAANAARVAAIKAVQKQMHRRTNSDDLPIPVVQNFHHLSAQLSVV